MKVCVLTTGHTPDDDRVYYKQLRSLLDLPCEFHLAAPGGPEAFAGLDERVRPLPLGPGAGLAGRLRLLPRALKAMRELRPDVIHFHDYEAILLVPWLRRIPGVRLVYDSHEMYPDMVLLSERIPRPLRPPVASVVRSIELAMARRCAHVITADGPVARYLEKSGTPASVVYNYPNLELFRPDPERIRQIRSERGDRPLLIYQGSMGIDRGLLQMVEAMKGLSRSHPAARLLLVGNLRPALRQRVYEAVARQGLEDHVECTGWVDHRDIVNWVGAASIGLIPFLPVEKYKKNIPIKQFEYMACGLPIVAADLPPIRRYVGEAECGILYPSGDVNALEAGIARLLDDAPERERMARAGRAAVEGKWNWSEMEEVLRGVYRELDSV